MLFLAAAAQRAVENGYVRSMPWNDHPIVAVFLGEAAVAQRHPVLAALFSDQVVDAALQLAAPQLFLQPRHAALCQQGVVGDVCLPAGQGGHGLFLNLGFPRVPDWSGVVVPHELEGREWPDARIGSAVPVDRPQLRLGHEVALQLLALGGEGPAVYGRLQEFDSGLEGHLGDLCGLDGLCRRGVLAAGVVDEVCALHGPADHTAGEGVGHEALRDPGAHVAAGGVVLQLRFQIFLALLPLLDFVDGDGIALVAVVAGVTRLCGLVHLGLLGHFA